MVVLLDNEETRALVADAAGGWGEGGSKYQLEAVFSLRSLLDYYASQEAEGKEESSEEMEKVGCAQRSCGGEWSVVICEKEKGMSLRRENEQGRKLGSNLEKCKHISGMSGSEGVVEARAGRLYEGKKL